PPLLFRETGEVEFLREGGPVLGIAKDASYEERPLFLCPGEMVIFYTDGVTEVFNEQGQEYGVDEIINTVAQNKDKTSQEILRIVHSAVRHFAAPDHVFDDFTMIVLKRL
ncbi:MAG: PP2C family protein-serine/threonine phosphatase, partial [Candidatus Zixiibacteriota bacterium]